MRCDMAATELLAELTSYVVEYYSGHSSRTRPATVSKFVRSRHVGACKL